MNDWNPDRIKQLHDRVNAGRAGLWVDLEGGPNDGGRGFLPHVEWQLIVLFDAEGYRWTVPYPPDRAPREPRVRIVGVYQYDGRSECMRWVPAT